MLPWSVIPTAGMPSRSTSANSGPICAIPSSIENSVWLCRCTKDLPDTLRLSPGTADGPVSVGLGYDGGRAGAAGVPPVARPAR